MRAFLLTCRQTAQLVGAHRKLWLPFLVVAVVEALFIGLVWLAPHPPYSKLLAPPLRYFFGDRILHYPWHLWFLYHAMKHTHFVASIVIGAFMSGIACVMVRQAHEGIPLSLRTALVSRQVAYGRVVLIWILMWGMGTGIMEAARRMVPQAAWLMGVSLGASVMLQALLVYAIPAAVFNGSPWWRALLQSARETGRHPISTMIVVAIPSAAVLLFAVTCSPGRLAQWMRQGAPEIAVALVIARLFVWIVTDAFLTVASAHLWWVHRAGQPAFGGLSAAAALRLLNPGRLTEGPVVA